MQSKSTASRSQFCAALVSPRHQMVIRWTDVIADTPEMVEGQLAGLRAAAALDGLTVLVLEYAWPKPIDPLPDDAGGLRTFGLRVRGDSYANWGILDGDTVCVDPDRFKGTRDLVLFRIFGADGRERDMRLVGIDDVDVLVAGLGPNDVIEAVGPATWVIPANPGFKPKRQRRSRTRPAIQQPTSDWTADLWPSVRDQLTDLLADN